MSTSPYHVYRLNDTDWWMAPSLEKAIKAAATLYGVSPDDLTDDPHQLTDEELDTKRYVDWNPEEEEPANGWPSRTFREELEARVAAGCETEPFATSEW